MVESPVFVKLTPGGIRTPDLLVRSQTLYPAELSAPAVLREWFL